MDLNKIWEKFGDFSSENEEEIREEVERLKSSPYYKLKSFEKHMKYYKSFMKGIYGFIEGGESEEKFKFEQAGQYVYLSNAYSYISECDFSKLWVLEIESIASESFLKSVQYCIEVFEQYENYERCALLKKISDLCIKKLDSPKKN